MAEHVLPFEKHVVELIQNLDRADNDADRAALEIALNDEVQTVFGALSAWERVQLARHPNRPRMLDYTGRLFDDFFELHGDRSQGDDPAMIAGIARFHGQSVVVVGQQKGVDTDEKVLRNFGMVHPEGYRKALRAMKLAERWGYPVITFVDTPAAHPGIEAEQHGQGIAIAQSLLEASRLETPVLSLILSEGGSGGALAIAVGDWIAMFEYAVYMICPPERCAEILWRDAEKKDLAASALRVTAQDLQELGVIDHVMPEPRGGAHRCVETATQVLREEIASFLAKCDRNEWSCEKRAEKFSRMGQWLHS